MELINNKVEFVTPKVKEVTVQLINEIVEKINTNNVDLVKLCERLYLSDEQLIDLLNRPQNKYSEYLEILKEVQDLIEGN